MSIFLEIWAELKVVATVIVLPFYGMMSLLVLAFTYKDYVEHFFFLTIFIIMVLDVIFDIILILASWNKNLCMFKIYYVYGIMYAITVPAVFSSWLLYAIHARDMDWRKSTVMKNIVAFFSILAGVLVVHCFVIYSIKKEIKKLTIRDQLEFVKKIAASENCLLPSKKEDV